MNPNGGFFIAASATATGANKEPGAAGVAVKKEAGRTRRRNGCGTRCGSLADEGVEEGKDEFTLMGQKPSKI